MGISDGLQGPGGVDCSVGAIVWVRRRNGSWWPGRILGSNELSAAHLMSPRSGTPVKLLGREDASVDWYNLEKSKRVKAFRCGEFDDCIERAESSQGIPIKKREKYARREDAILHALELEKQLLDNKQQKLGISSGTSSKMPGKLISTSQMGSDNGKFGNVKSQDESMGNPLYVQKVKKGKQPSWEDDNSESIPRMRGLQDFGLKITPSKRKLHVSSVSEGSRRAPSVENHSHILSNGAHNMGKANHVSSSKNSVTGKRKRLQGSITEESNVKKRDRRRPLVQVLQSSAILPVLRSFQSDGDAVSISMPSEKEQTEVTYQAKKNRDVYLPADKNGYLDHPECAADQIQLSQKQYGMDNFPLHPDSSTEGNSSSELMEYAESDSSEKDFLDPGVGEETTLLSDATQMQTLTEPRNSGYQVKGELGSMSSEEPDEAAPTGYMPHLYPHDQNAAVDADVGVSKWQLKGKRNIRNLTKRPMEVIDGKCSDGSIYETNLQGMENKISRRALGQGFYHRGEELNYGYGEDDLIDKDSVQTQMVEFGNRRYPLKLKAASKDRSRIITETVDSEEDSVGGEDGLSQSALRGYWEDQDDCFNPVYVGHRLGNWMESMLVDVDLKVQASYQGERVPLVSLMSRLNGKAIIGHPIQIEALENGFSDNILSINDDFDEQPVENDGSTALPPVWRTARRTTMHRVPRPQPSSALDGEEAADLHLYPDLESKPLHKKPYGGNVSHKARLMRKSISQIHRPPTEEKFPRRLWKKVSLSSQKTRTLSSIAIEQKPNGKVGQPTLTSISNLEGLVKPEETGPTVTCIPVKLVFSRLMEAVGRPPSRAANRGVLLKGIMERKPS